MRRGGRLLKRGEKESTHKCGRDHQVVPSERSNRGGLKGPDPLSRPENENHEKRLAYIPKPNWGLPSRTKHHISLGETRGAKDQGCLMTTETQLFDKKQTSGKGG